MASSEIDPTRPAHPKTALDDPTRPKEPYTADADPTRPADRATPADLM